MWPFRIRCQQFRHHVEGLRTRRFWLAFFLACVLHALGTKLAAVRGFRKLRIAAFCLASGLRTVWLGHHVRLLHGIWRCGRLVSDPASQRGCWPQEKYWFRTQPRSEGAGHKKCFMDSKGDGKHFFWLVFLACLSSACCGVWPFRIRCPRASFLCLCRL